MSYILQILVDSVFRGSLILTPLLFVIHIFKIQLYSIDKIILVRATNYTLLIGSLIYILSFGVFAYKAIFSGGEYEQFRLTGKYGLAFWAFIIISYAFLPQILWIKKLQMNIISSLIIIGIWSVLSITVRMASYSSDDQINWEPILITCFEQTLVYLAIVSVVYLILNKRRMLSK
jgi:hypothetical protein